MDTVMEYGEYEGEFEWKPEPEIEKFTVREEIVLIFFNSMLESIVDGWIPVEKDNADYIPCKSSVCSKPYMELEEEDLEESIVLSIEGSVISLGQKLHPSTRSLEPDIPTKTKTKKHSKAHSEIKNASSAQKIKKSKLKLKKPKKETAQEIEDIKEEEPVLSSQSELNWVLNPPDEYVVIEFKNGNRYEGPIFRKHMNGHGTFNWADGTQYIGEFYRGDITGQGCLTFQDLSWYEGEFYKGFRHGRGSMYISGTPQMYNGSWSCGQKDGKGWMLYGPQDWYDGEWKDCLRNGQGLRQYTSKARYLGTWKEGLRHGMGCMVWNNKDFYKGEWENGFRSGYGEYLWKIFFNKTLSFPAENKYRGTWEKGLMHGVGVLHFGMEGGARLAGVWQQNKKHGAGVIVCENGIIIQSNPLFMNDKPVHLKETGSLDIECICQPIGTSTPNKSQAHIQQERSIENVATLQSFDMEIKTEFEESRVMDNSTEPSFKTLFSGSIFAKTSMLTLQKRCCSLKMIMSQINTKQSSCGLDPIIKENIEMHSNRFQTYKEKYKSLAIPLQMGSEHITVDYYVQKALQKINILHHDSMVNTTLDFYLKSNTPRKKDMSNGPSTFKTLSGSWSKKTSLPITPMEVMPIFEEKWLRNTIILYLPKLRDLYDWYATVACIDIPTLPFHPIMVRMFLWQMYRDCKLPEKGISLVQTDMILDHNEDSGVEHLHNPFERIYFWQFLHSLISVAWELYSDDVTYDGTVSILKLVFTKFLEEDIFPNARHFNGSALFEFRNVLPLQAVYGWYLSFGEPHTVRTFLNSSCIAHGNSPPISMQCNPFIETPELIFGENIVTLDQHVSYIIPEKPKILTEPEEEPIYANDDDLYRMNLLLFRHLGAKRILKFIYKVCPSIKKDDDIVEIDYPLTFLEFYEIILICAKKLIEMTDRRQRKADEIMTKEILDDIIERSYDLYALTANSKSKRRHIKINKK